MQIIFSKKKKKKQWTYWKNTHQLGYIIIDLKRTGSQEEPSVWVSVPHTKRRMQKKRQCCSNEDQSHSTLQVVGKGSPPSPWSSTVFESALSSVFIQYNTHKWAWIHYKDLICGSSILMQNTHKTEKVWMCDIVAVSLIIVFVLSLFRIILGCLRIPPLTAPWAWWVQWTVMVRVTAWLILHWWTICSMDLTVSLFWVVFLTF